MNKARYTIELPRVMGNVLANTKNLTKLTEKITKEKLRRLTMSKLFQDNDGHPSSVRVIAFICVCTAIYLAVTGTGDAGTIGIFLGAGIGGKVMQKMTGEQLK